MRRKDRAVTDFSEIQEILASCKVCRLAMVDKGRPYLVPLNFGYTLDQERLILYFHSAAQGRKIDILKENPIVCFEMDCGHQLVAADSACQHGYRFASIIGEGQACFLTQAAEKLAALEKLMKHQTGTAEHTFLPEMLELVTVFQVEADWFTAKKRQ